MACRAFGIGNAQLALSAVWGNLERTPHFRACLQEQRRPTEEEWNEMLPSLNEQYETWEQKRQNRRLENVIRGNRSDYS